MRISSVGATVVRVPIERPIKISTRALGAREYVLIDVATDEGLLGTGFTYAGTVAGAATAAFVNDVLAPLLVDQDPRLISHHWEVMYQEVLLSGRRGAALRAIAAIDIALWDLLGQAAGLPLYQLLGACMDEVPVYASGGYYRPGDPIEHIREELSYYRDQGFRDFKIKVGGAPLRADVARVEAAREVIGPDASLALDANNAWRWPHEAAQFAEAVQEYGIWWLEEPLSPEDIAGHAQLTDALSMPVATGEIHATRWDFRALIEQRAADILQPDAGVLGGVTEWMRVAQTAATFNLPLAPHWHANIHVHLAAAVPNCMTVEYFSLETDIFNFERLVIPEARLKPSNGRIALSTAPGHGVVFDPERIAEWRV